MVTALDQRTALVLIDLQIITLRRPLLAPASELLANANKLLAAFRQAGLPVVLVTVDPSRAAGQPLRNDVRRSPQAALAPDLLALTPEIEPAPSDLRLVKHTWGAFYGTDLDEQLKRRGVTGLVLGGVATSIGVESTARAAHERGYNLTFAQDALTDTVASAQENSLRTIFPRIGELDSTDNIIKLLAAR